MKNTSSAVYGFEDEGKVGEKHSRVNGGHGNVSKKKSTVVDGANTILLQRTLRSGQAVRYPGNVVIMGDVNPGAEVMAGGNIIVMGSLRGVAHAGAEGNEKAVVAAFRLKPTQLRIASHFTRAPDGDYPEPEYPEIAKIIDGMVIIENYHQGSNKAFNLEQSFR
ncbi:MAG: septum site-determining protein MinC [Bacillota bacterium]